jgi:hypothetical protein
VDVRTQQFLQLTTLIHGVLVEHNQGGGRLLCVGFQRQFDEDELAVNL